MAKEKTKVTLIGARLAKPGLDFVYEGITCTECEGCKVRKVCHNLQPGKRYRVTTVRANTRHDCPVHHEAAVAVDVVEAPIVALVSADMAIANSRISYEFSCPRTECRSYRLCRPDGIIEGEKYVVGEVLGNAPDVCERGRPLKLVELRPA
ncbi:UPF0179 family protein [Methanoculleus sp. YWC-01]|jgi:uncharacterized protein (UPF0179 family)|uniref:UPF0179 protein HL657_06315 n=1 Tax=Methanoculleus nereidis TaxID=2735141 RepID=A0ABU3Z1V4_9EURY|nr:UPF0179 family protein [Methanoculleus sp. YWC-01]MCK9297988.1 UPF0179 family protein [Methanoculleus sp.]MDV4342792.1 UPF0179 family protein [Methanoculleus sp. YWC-01]